MTPYLEALARELAPRFIGEREPVYARALVLLAESLDGPFGAALEDLWRQRVFNARYERSLLLLAALRYDALLEGPSHPLHAAIAADSPRVDAFTPARLAAAVAPQRELFYEVLRTRAVQTNETTRAVAWLWPAHLLWSSGERRALTLVDLGASAGLNLVADALPAIWTDGAGAPLPVAPLPPLVMRLGVDRSPLNVGRDADAYWLRACVWPSDARRRERLEQGIAAYQARAAAADAPRLVAAGLADAWPMLEVLPRDGIVLGVQTIVRDYLTAEDRARYEAAKLNFLRARPPRSAFIAELELDESPQSESSERDCALVLRFRENGARAPSALTLARSDPHPRQLFVDAAAVAALVNPPSARASR